MSDILGYVQCRHNLLFYYLENHFNLRPSWHLGNSIKVKAQTNTSLPYILNESLGFEDYLRGYEYYVFDGEHYAMC